MMDYKEILDSLGEKASNLSNEVIQKISEKFGLEVASLPVKLLTIIFLLTAFYFSLKIAHKFTKIILIVVIALFIISIGFSIIK